MLRKALQLDFKMNQHNIRLLDLPNEILFLILKKLDNIDVLYSLLGINNQRLNIIAQEQNFTNILNFVSISQSTDEISSISAAILNRFCIDILPRIHKNVKSLSIESIYLEYILGAGHYPNLTELKLFNLNKEIFLRYLIEDFNDVHALLDGRLKQLTRFIVQVHLIEDHISTSHKRVDLPNLKCFSLTSYHSTVGFNTVVVPLLRRMSYLEELTLYIRIWNRLTFIAGTYLDNEILIHMPKLHTFTFYIASKNDNPDPAIRISNDDIQRTFTNKEHRPMTSMVDYFDPYKIICRIFSLPFKFHRLDDIGNNIPNIVFNSVTHLKLWDKDEFKHEFFIRLARAFPFLKNLSIWNIKPPFLGTPKYHLRYKDWCSIIEYPHLISLDIECVNTYYVEHFLNEEKAHLPHLTELKVCYDSLKFVTKNFTRDKTRRNCARIKRLIVENPITYPKDVYRYFPLLAV
ncbi:unnamed protein product [Rotaria sp. Silwood1]|nr:unnamed protein product [Rotaria sp. Silwood1]